MHIRSHVHKHIRTHIHTLHYTTLDYIYIRMLPTCRDTYNYMKIHILCAHMFLYDLYSCVPVGGFDNQPRTPT